VRKVLTGEQVIDRMSEEHAEAGALRRRYGYFTLRAAIRQAFDWPRREFQPD